MSKVVQIRDFVPFRPPGTMRDEESDRAESATVIILPTVRIEHYDHFLDNDPPPKRKRRRPF